MQTLAVVLVSLLSCSVQAGPIDGLPLPKPDTPKSHFSSVIGWKLGERPTVPKGFTVSRFAENLKEPRWIYADPSSTDVFIAESEAGRVTRFRDQNKDGVYETREPVVEKLDRPFGMLIVKDTMYVAVTDGIFRYAYPKGTTKLMNGAKVMSLPAGGYNNHWTRNLLLSKDGARIFVSVGSGSNVGENGLENEVRRANSLSVDLNGKDEKVFASGLRNPVGMDLASDGRLWAAVNERDNLGDNLVPDYLTSVREGGFYGWPFSYFGQHEDPRMKGQRPDLVAKAIVPDVALGSHTASLGLAFYNGVKFPARYRGGAFIGQHGSWNRSSLVGYAVKFVPFDKNGKPTGAPEDFLTGFIADAKDYKVHGRPVGVTLMQDGSLLVADDGGNIIWQVRSN